MLKMKVKVKIKIGQNRQLRSPDPPIVQVLPGLSAAAPGRTKSVRPDMGRRLTPWFH